MERHHEGHSEKIREGQGEIEGVCGITLKASVHDNGAANYEVPNKSCEHN